MYGGEEEPCIPGGALELIQLKLGQRCPRVDLEEENTAAAEALIFLTHRDLKPLAAAAFEAIVTDRGLNEHERAMTLFRISAALSDPENIRMLHPSPEGETIAAEAE